MKQRWKPNHSFEIHIISFALFIQIFFKYVQIYKWHDKITTKYTLWIIKSTMMLLSNNS